MGTVIGAYKAAVTRHIRRLTDLPGRPIWQRNYYDHIIRSEADLNRIQQYIASNPANWQSDSLYR